MDRQLRSSRRSHIRALTTKVRFTLRGKDSHYKRKGRSSSKHPRCDRCPGSRSVTFEPKGALEKTGLPNRGPIVYNLYQD